MAFGGLFARGAQVSATYASNSNDLSRTGSMSACALATIAALGLVICAASQNVSYGWATGSAKSETAGYILAGGALAAALMAPVCWAVAIMGRGIAVRLAALFLGCWLLLYGVTASLGFVSTSRQASISGHQAVVDAYQDSRAVRDAARSELATLATVKVPTKAILDRRRELAAMLANPPSTAHLNAAPVEADPQSAAIAGYLQALGWAATTDKVSLWLTAFTVTFFEIASALALSVAAALYPSTRRTAPEPPPAAAPAQRPDVPAKPETAPGARAAQRSDDKDDPPPPKPPRRPGRPHAVLPADAIERLRKAGGKANGIRGAAKLLGTSKSTAHRVLHQLASAGLIRLDTGPCGVSVALA